MVGDGFGSVANDEITELHEYGGDLYAGTGRSAAGSLSYTLHLVTFTISLLINLKEKNSTMIDNRQYVNLSSVLFNTKLKYHHENIVDPFGDRSNG